MSFARRAAFLTAVLVCTAVAAPRMTVGAAEPDTVLVGAVSSASDAPFLIADRKGYFKEEGIKVTFQIFASGATMIAPIGAGQLDVGGGAPAAGLYNAIARGINLRIVADRGTDSPGYGFDPIVVRKDLVTSGKYKKIADLKGMRVAESAKGSTTTPELVRLLAKGGLQYDDVQHVFLAFPEQVAALKNGSIDATVALEPWATLAEKEGVGVRVLPDDQFYPNQQLATVFYGQQFIEKRPDVARRFMRAYIKGARFYHDALKNGHLAGPTSGEVIAILADVLKLDPSILRAMTPGDINPNGRVNAKSLIDDYETFRKLGLVTAEISMDKVIDNHFADEAAKSLGKYKQAR